MKLQNDPDRLLGNGARLISNFWAASWISFSLASGLAHGLTLIRFLFDVVLPGLFFGLLQFVARQAAALGGLLLLLIGVIIAVALPITSSHWHRDAVVFIFLTMALPPLVAGIMFLTDWRIKNSHRSEASSARTVRT